MIRMTLYKVMHITAVLALIVCLGATDAHAKSEARSVLENTINDVLGELQKPELKNPSTRNSVLKRVEDIIDRLFSFEEFSMRTVGPNWKNFSQDQQRRFTEAFESLLRETYLEKLDGYNGEVVNYTGESSSSKGDKVEIATSITIQGKPVPVAYRMIKKQQWEVYDVIIEGVSMVQNYRSQFQDILKKGDVEGLITQVLAKADQIRAQNRK